jgi:hypothetical protein
MIFRPMQRRATLLGVVALVACGGNEAKPKDDPNARAVVGAPPVVLPSDTAKPDTTAALAARQEEARQRFVQAYAFISGMMVLGDAKALLPLYASGARLTTPTDGVEGADRVAPAMVTLGRRLGLKDLRRASRSITFHPGNIVADSGYYVIVTQRGEGAEKTEQGIYATQWRMLPVGQEWQIVSDRIYAPGPLVGARKAP